MIVSDSGRWSRQSQFKILGLTHLKPILCILNILFMAPRMVYCMIRLTLEQKRVNDYEASS